MKSQGQQIRENIEDAPHPDDVDRDEFHGGDYIAYTARLLMEVGDGSETVADELSRIEHAHSQISASIDITEAVEEEAPEVAEEIDDLELSGAFFIRSCRYANAAIHGVDES